MLSSSLYTLLTLSKTTSPQELFAYDCVTLYRYERYTVENPKYGKSKGNLDKKQTLKVLFFENLFVYWLIRGLEEKKPLKTHKGLSYLP